MVMINYIKNKWLTWHTGRNREEREWQQWCLNTVVSNANTIENMFMNFQYIIPVSTGIFDLEHPFGWVANKEFQEYLYPTRPLDQCAVYYFARGYRDPWDGRFYLDDIRHQQDQVFVATNNQQDAMMIALRWA